MSITCGDGKHVALARPIRNQGFEFGRCRKCGRDLVRSRRAWRTIPPGFRVVWRHETPVAAAAGAAQSPAAAAAGRGQSRFAAGVELALLGVRGLAAAIADRVRFRLKARPARRIAIAGALAPPAR